MCVKLYEMWHDSCCLCKLLLYPWSVLPSVTMLTVNTLYFLQKSGWWPWSMEYHNILLMLPQEWHIENLGPSCCLRQSWSKCYMLLQWSSWKSDLNCIVKLCWNNWWLFTSPKQPCWCPNGDLVMPMIPVANWDPGEFHGQ